MVITADPAVVRHILKDNFDNYIKPRYLKKCVQDLVGEGIFAVSHGPHSEDSGASWTLQRKTAAKVFTNNNFNSKIYSSLAAHAELTSKVIDRKLADDATKPIDMQALMFQFTLDSIGDIGFGVELDSLNKHSAFAHAFDRAQDLCLKRFYVKPFWDSPLGPYMYKDEPEIAELIRTLNDAMFDIVKHRRENPRELGDDILSLFLQEKLGFSDAELRDVVFSFIIAGRDTTAALLSFCLLMLAKHPEWQQVLFDEITAKRQSVAGKTALPAQELATMKQLHGVVMETLRLYPPLPTDSKEACEDDVLPGGFKVPKGTRVAFEPYLMARTPSLWGDDCLEFKPDRWSQMKTMPSPYEFPVFQAGPRICLGESMAKFEAQLMLAYLVERYTFAFPADVQPESKTYVPGLTIKVKDGLHLVVKKRE